MTVTGMGNVWVGNAPANRRGWGPHVAVSTAVSAIARDMDSVLKVCSGRGCLLLTLERSGLSCSSAGPSLVPCILCPSLCGSLGRDGALFLL